MLGDHAMRYAPAVDILLPTIVYLGTHDTYWARSPSSLAKELSLNEGTLRATLGGFPSLFRQSVRLSPGGQPYYALQARYANREGLDIDDPDEIHWIKPVSEERLNTILSFVTGMAEAERAGRRSWIAVVAAIIAAVAAITSALVKQ
jgi:hypothetical protein